MSRPFLKTYVIITECGDGLYENEVKATTIEEAYCEAEKFGGHAICEKWELLSQGLGIVVESPNECEAKSKPPRLPERKIIDPIQTTTEEKPVPITSRLPKLKKTELIAEIEQPIQSGFSLIYALMIVGAFVALGGLYIGAADYFLFSKLETMLSGGWLSLAKWMIASPVIIFPVGIFFAVK